jgi:hypothetical protein
MPRMVTTARMVDAMRTVLRDRSIPQEDRDLLVDSALLVVHLIAHRLVKV